MHVLIIGAGLAGVSTAATLIRKGFTITLLDAAPHAGTGTSFANGGHLSAGDAHPWASPDSLWHMAAGLISPARPFRLYPRADKTQWQFLWRFLRAATPSGRQQAGKTMVTLAQHSLASLAMTEHHPPQSQWMGKQCGILHLYHRSRAWEIGWQAAKDSGLKVEKIPANALPELEPALAHNHYRGGVLFPDDRVGDAYLYVKALLEQIQTPRLQLLLDTPAIGFTHEGKKIVAVQTPKGDVAADMVVLAAGVASAELVRDCLPTSLCPPLPLYPVMGYSLTAPAGIRPPNMGLLDVARRIVATPLGQQVRVAGMADIAGYKPVLRRGRLNTLHHSATKMIPHALGDTPQFWAGARPMTPDGLPLLGFAREGGNLLLHTGHGSLGWTLCHATAELTAQLANGEKPTLDLSPFRPDRF